MAMQAVLLGFWSDSRSLNCVQGKLVMASGHDKDGFAIGNRALLKTRHLQQYVNGNAGTVLPIGLVQCFMRVVPCIAWFC